MILLKPEVAQGLDDPQALRAALQAAIELEHATIPPYLYALYSLYDPPDGAANREIASLLRSVVLEEMTHMGLACNILNAIGGAPSIDTASFIPEYPGALPGGIESQLTVPLSPFTPDLVFDVFMVIEEPETAIEFRDTLELAPHLTIGQFYEAIAAQLSAEGDAIFTGDPSRQVSHELGSAELVAVSNLADALHAINTIVEQGEGTTKVPVDERGELAHYYKFAEIHHGHRLVLNPDVAPDAPPEDHYSYTGAEIAFDPAGVRPLVLNPKRETYPAGSEARYANDSFNYTYTSLLKSLHATFNGQPRLLTASIGLMESCKQQALELGALPFGKGRRAGPSFQYQPTNP